MGGPDRRRGHHHRLHVSVPVEELCAAARDDGRGHGAYRTGAVPGHGIEPAVRRSPAARSGPVQGPAGAHDMSTSPLPLIISVTGHRDLRPEDVPALEGLVRTI